MGSEERVPCILCDSQLYNDNMACTNDAKILKDPEIWLSMIRKGKLDSEIGGREVQKLLKKFDLINGFPLMFWADIAFGVHLDTKRPKNRMTRAYKYSESCSRGNKRK